jgi:hypothetical protein
MADADVPITAGTGTKIDTRTVGAGTDEHRQVMVIGDPLTAASVAAVSTTGSLQTQPVPQNFISSVNSSATLLGAGATFTGIGELISDYAAVYVSVFASHASATDGLQLQQSSNGTNWDIVDSYTIPAGVGKVYVLNQSAAYFRLVYTNGGTLQTAFRLQVIYRRYVGLQSSQRAQDAQTNETDLQQLQAFGMVWNGATWDRLPGSTAGLIGRPAPAATSNVSRVAGATSDTTLKTANTARLGLLLYNESTATCYVKYGTGASATSYTVQMGPGAYWEMPVQNALYTGQVNGLWTAAAGNMQVTEIAP